MCDSTHDPFFIFLFNSCLKTLHSGLLSIYTRDDYHSSRRGWRRDAKRGCALRRFSAFVNNSFNTPETKSYGIGLYTPDYRGVVLKAILCATALGINALRNYGNWHSGY